MVKVLPAPSLTVAGPLGDMVPLAPAEAVMVWVVMAKVAAMVWSSVTVWNV